MKVYTVNINGKAHKNFSSEKDARDYMLFFVHWQAGVLKQFEYIDDAVNKSNLSDAKEVINHIMSLK